MYQIIINIILSKLILVQSNDSLEFYTNMINQKEKIQKLNEEYNALEEVNFNLLSSSCILIILVFQ